MRVLMLGAMSLLLALVPACGGKARHVVIHPDEVGARRGDGWRITSEPSGGRRADDSSGAPHADGAAATP